MLSLELIIRGAKGESVEESDDIEKEVALLERTLKEIGKERKSFSGSFIKDFFEQSIIPFLNVFVSKSQIFDRFYFSKEITISFLNKGQYKKDIHISSVEKIKELILQALKEFNDNNEEFSSLEVFYSHSDFKNNKLDRFNYFTKLRFKFERYDYSLFEIYKKEIFKSNYNHILTNKEFEEIINPMTKEHLKYIKDQIPK